MAKKSKTQRAPKAERDCCGSDCCGESNCCGAPAPGCCQVEAVVRVDDRGQMVLPKEVRTRAGIHPEEKLAIVSWKRGEGSCCLSLFRVSDLAEAVRQAYGPMLRDIAPG